MVLRFLSSMLILCSRLMMVLVVVVLVLLGVVVEIIGFGVVNFIGLGCLLCSICLMWWGKIIVLVLICCSKFIVSNCGMG